MRLGSSRIPRVLCLWALMGASACGTPNDPQVLSLGTKSERLTALEYSPVSTLLPPGSTSVAFNLKTDAATACRYAIGSDPGYAGMKPFSVGDGTTEHSTTLEGLSSDPLQVNQVSVRCDADPSFLLTLRYRSLSDAKPSFPRTGNLWGWWGLIKKGAEHAARIDLFLGAAPKPEEIVQLRQLNPNILILTSINTVEEGSPEKTGLPDSYYLKDTTGKPIEVWPGAFRVNITKPEVARFKAQEAYKTIEATGFQADGCFFDNFLLMPSWLTHDMWGNQVSVDADEDGQADDPDTVDAAWRQGAIAELTEFRKLMPHAYVSGHAIPLDKEVGPLFNGEGIGFLSSDVLEREADFPALWKRYQDWWALARSPVITMLESSTRDDIAYGFSYEPEEQFPASTLEFARTYYPDMRFGLAFTLLGDGYFSHEIGDTWHGNDWWYDELDYDLGEACGPAQRVEISGTPTTNLIDNGGFEQGLQGTWTNWVNTAAGAAATIATDSTEAKEGTSSVRIDITQAGEAVSWHISVMQPNRSLEQGKLYDLVFWAKADSEHLLVVNAQKGAADWDSYGLWQQVTLSQTWTQFTASFESKVTATDARIGFNVGASAGKVWLDDVRLVEHPPDVLQREFTKGKALLNATRKRQTINVGSGFSRLQGDQAPRWQFLIDDQPPSFSADSSWTQAEYDSGEWTAVGPFYHDWGPYLHRSEGTGIAEWKLDLPGDDTYTLQAWWPGGPQASGFTDKAVYEIVAGGTVLASQTFDQRAEGNQWHTIGDVALVASAAPSVRLRKEGSGVAIADALHVFSKSRLNDGSSVESLELLPQDGIVLRRTSGAPCVPAAAGAAGAGGAGPSDSGLGGSSGMTATEGGTDGPAEASTSEPGPESDDGGCGCRGAARPPSAWGWMVSLVVLGACRIRRRLHPSIKAPRSNS